jgi:gamma-glutamyltranspeptidase/glutathione hydrolase
MAAETAAAPLVPRLATGIEGLRGLALLLTVVAATAAPAHAQQAADGVAPEVASTTDAVSGAFSAEVRAALAAKGRGEPFVSDEWMVVAANPLAAEAGARVLGAGGTAADAMVAVQAVLGLVEPQSSGLGGGGFLVWYDAATGEVTTLDGRETAPLAATPGLFLDRGGAPLEFFDAVVGGRAVGTPGTPMLLEEAHRRWGRADWSGLFDDAIALAEGGFPVSPRLAALVEDDAERLKTFRHARRYFFSLLGTPVRAGDTLKNPAYADTLRRIAAEGSTAFYTGPVAADIVAVVQSARGNPGRLSELDLAAYRVIERPAVCVPYRVYEVCGMGPPSSGGLTVGQILGMLDGKDLAELGPGSAEAWRLVGDASRLAFADRGQFMADGDFVDVPVAGLIAPDYLARRAELLAGDDALPEVVAGDPAPDSGLRWAPDDSLDLPSTSHVSIIDGDGNALSMTTSIENAFGSRLMVRGFLLNNQLTDFSFTPDADGVPVANRVEPGKRPRSSMAPTIVLRDGKPVLILGSSGGSWIIGYVVRTIIAHLDWGMNIQEAVAMPHLVNRFGPFELEAGTAAEAMAPALTALGYEVTATTLTSGLQAIAVGERLSGGADPRREGVALGQ